MARRIAPRLVEEVMSSPPETVKPTLPVRELSGLFTTYDFNAFPVVKSPSVLVGIVTKLDLLRMFRSDRARLRPALADLWAEHVVDIMRRRVVTVAPRDSVTMAIDHMLASKLRSLPVVERRGGKTRLVGIVSRGDVLRALIFENRKAH